MTMPTLSLVLASTSPYRRLQLEQLGLAFEAVAPGVDEEALGVGAVSPDELALRLARAKAEAVRLVRPTALVLGADQVVALGEARLGKPGSRARAIEQLLHMQGRTHELVTGVAVLGPGFVHEQVVVTRMTMRALSREQVERYVELDQPWDCAGAYKFEAHGPLLFERVETEDPTAILGLPLLTVVRALAAAGWTLP